MIRYILNRLFGSNDDDRDYHDLGGADAVFNAITERTDSGFEVQIELGEPRLIDRGELTEDLYVVIPTYTENGPNPADLEFDLPDGIGDASAEFFDLLDAFGIEKVADVFDLRGKSVPGERMSGTVVPKFNELVEE
ncbi:hypothetical protein HfxHF1_245 [Halophage HF1]|uniref:Uncharacterized protein n=2 Tax=Haloferacalesvirus TaxID=2843389 RepID=Q8V6S2_9CAUD|nr:hypothetical protein HrrHF2_245 [Halorubrum phage HF2]NP_861619.2 hypothetical protein HfxHF1_245 [Halophage HF1]AAL54953.2 hypothetical protein HrrHF2_245 [Halorubrum phage HF2]AAO61330.2 hypothetical protein HfxHF1_245 [Halophage HF1]QIR31120.1 hypothetical protein HrrHc2_415 [Halorubrum virus Hardycor2]